MTPDWSRVAQAQMPANCGWQGHYRVRYSEIGANGRTTLPALADYMQDSAGWGAKDLQLAYDDTVSRGVAWVLARMVILVHHYPSNGEALRLETWPSGFSHRMASRDWRLYDEAGDICAVAQSFWALFDLKQRRAAPWPDWLVARLPDPPGPKLLEVSPRPASPPEDLVARNTMIAQASDLDIYGHVNNVRLMQWILGTTNNGLANFQPNGIDIQFRAECRLHDRVMIRQTDDYAAISRTENTSAAGHALPTDLVRARIMR
ncbi:acyl-ACP thioesterase [Thalassospira profundimaris]|uniref:Acyl-ACP thioesterase n=1 Tax=Thalassospira profundimaris TaxID=502049 RepID=A0A367X1Z1_9PROT|nr:acyl-ACP thioesterase domain-containing protein [Thalassospira profundimaris]RCK47040.1 acyl-ACP thioesterase [Thalassospira profundimaris]